MEMKPTNSKLAEDMAYGQRVMFTTTPDADRKENKDYIIGELGIAFRRRRFSINKYGEISIRNDRKSGAKTERQKILDGECKSQLFIWEFTDAYVICVLPDIYLALASNAGYAKNNNDKITSAYYISINKVKHLVVFKQPLRGLIECPL